MVLSDELRDEFADHHAVVDYEQDEQYLKLEVRPYGNSTLLHRIQRTDGLTLGNIGTCGSGNLRVNIRHE